MDNYFKQLYDIDVAEKTAKKNGLTYLSWAAAWAEVKKLFPDANYIVYENECERPWFDDGRTAWVKTGVIINNIEHIERLPVMDFKNKSIPADVVTSMDANKAVQRSLTKACGRHGLGLYIYEGEDIPESTKKKDDTLKHLKAEIVKLAKKKISEGVNKDVVYAVVSKNNDGNINPNSIQSVEVCNVVIEEINKLKKENK